MNTQDADDSAEALKSLIASAVSAHQERDLYRRILAQAVLTHGGELRVDVSFAAQAKQVAQLDIGAGGVRILS